MRLAVGILALLLVVAVLLAAPLIAHRARPWPDCISHIVIVKGRDGGPFGQRVSTAAEGRRWKKISVTPCCVLRRVTSV